MNSKAPDMVGLAASTTLRISNLPTARQQTAALKQHIEACNVFMGILREGIGEHRWILVKGRKVLEDIVASGEQPFLYRGAIFVTCVEEAIAMRHVFGDGEDTAKTPELKRACLHWRRSIHKKIQRRSDAI